MKEVNYWKQFWETGKIDDYLSYRADLSAISKHGDATGSVKEETTDATLRETSLCSTEKGSGADWGDASFDGSFRG